MHAYISQQEILAKQESEEQWQGQQRGGYGRSGPRSQPPYAAKAHPPRNKPWSQYAQPPKQVAAVRSRGPEGAHKRASALQHVEARVGATQDPRPPAKRHMQKQGQGQRAPPASELVRLKDTQPAGIWQYGLNHEQAYNLLMAGKCFRCEKVLRDNSDHYVSDGKSKRVVCPNPWASRR